LHEILALLSVIKNFFVNPEFVSVELVVALWTGIRRYEL